MATSDWDALMGSKAPERGHTTNEGGKYEHWGDREAEKMRGMGENSADCNAFRDGKAGMKGKENPDFKVHERERGDSTAKGRDAAMPFEAEPFDVNQWDRKD
jgi:hypothetical protein